MILPVALGAAGLREAVVHADAATRRDPLHVAVEYLSADCAAVVFVEAEVAEVVEQTSGLRGDFGINTGDVVSQGVRSAGVILQPGVPVPHGREAEAGHGRILGRVREL